MNSGFSEATFQEKMDRGGKKRFRLTTEAAFDGVRPVKQVKIRKILQQNKRIFCCVDRVFYASQ